MNLNLVEISYDFNVNHLRHLKTRNHQEYYWHTNNT